jgi:inorganic pyrophosphatase
VDVEVIVEIPKGSRNKYEVDHDSDAIWLDRMLFTATQYPTDYGYFPGTLGEDGDPLDALILLDEATFPGCHILARPVGVFFMEDEKGSDAKVLCVPATDPRWSGLNDLSDLSPHLLDEIAHFFEVYKQLEPGKRSEISGWQSVDVAETVVAEARERASSDPGHDSDRGPAGA